MVFGFPARRRREEARVGRRRASAGCGVGGVSRRRRTPLSPPSSPAPLHHFHSSYSCLRMPGHTLAWAARGRRVEKKGPRPSRHVGLSFALHAARQTKSARRVLLTNTPCARARRPASAPSLAGLPAPLRVRVWTATPRAPPRTAARRPATSAACARRAQPAAGGAGGAGGAGLRALGEATATSLSWTGPLAGPRGRRTGGEEARKASMRFFFPRRREWEWRAEPRRASPHALTSSFRWTRASTAQARAHTRSLATARTAPPSSLAPPLRNRTRAHTRPPLNFVL